MALVRLRGGRGVGIGVGIAKRPAPAAPAYRAAGYFSLANMGGNRSKFSAVSCKNAYFSDPCNLFFALFF